MQRQLTCGRNALVGYSDVATVGQGDVVGEPHQRLHKADVQCVAQVTSAQEGEVGVRLHNKVKHQVAQGGLSRHIPHSTVGPHSKSEERGDADHTVFA